MPRELKKRGRRGEEKKRKLEEEEEGVQQDLGQPKRQRTEDAVYGVDVAAEQDDFIGLPQDGAYTNGDYQDGEGQGQGPQEQVFFGMLDEEEQEYFKRADEMLEMNNFADAEERSLFLANVYREANGKELKIANSQSCSRLMERLIQLSTPAQLKTLFQKFSGNFMHLFQHRFASHCCEKLFIQAAPAVTQELLHPPKPEDQTTADGDIYVSMENLFLFTLGEMEGNVGFLMTDRFASHTLRVLLLVLAGEPLSDSTNKSLMQSKKKEHVTVNGTANNDDSTKRDKEDRRAVPKSFTEALEKLMTASVSGLDTTSLRALATHQLGNPALQLLIRLELTHFGKSKAKDENSIFRTLLPDDPITPECDSAAFINGLLFDPIGSHLIECIIEHAPGKMFKSLYRGLLKDRMASLARNEIACYVVCKVLERLSKDDLLEAHEQICPQIPSLLERNRFAVIKTLIARCAVREVDSQAIAVQMSEAYSGPEGFDVVKMLKPDADEPAPNGNPAPEGMPAHIAEERANPHTIKLQGSLLAQNMILVPGALSALILESLASLPPTTLQKMASDTIICRTLQAAMTSHNASIISRRKLIQQFFGHIGEMALDSKASRVVDAIWEGTHGLAFIRERIAEELNENEAALRDNPCGRAVWKNWKMDLYKRRRGEWVKQSKIKASNDGFQSFSEIDTNLKAANAQDTRVNKRTHHRPQQQDSVAVQAGGEKKSAIQLARERHAANKARSQEARQKAAAGGSRPSGSSNSSKHASGANAVSSTKA